MESLHNDVEEQSAVARSYGSIGGKPYNERSAQVLDLFAIFQRVMPYVIGLWLLSFFGLRYVATTGTSHAAPAPAPAASRPTCSAYRYPECEGALHYFLSVGAPNRCAAFERVKAEGDFFQFPFVPGATATCSQPGCCGCPGQCSKCPPVLPECSSWRLDGTWRVALQDGVEVLYTFDAHGHSEIRQPASSLPQIWKRYDAAYVPTGNDVMVMVGTLREAQAKCKEYATCRSIVYNEAGLDKAGVGQMFLKTVTELVTAPGSGWVSWINDQHPNLVGEAAIAGPLVPMPGSSPGQQAFRIDLHRAAPHLFPAGSEDILSVGGDEGLVVRRQIGQAREPAHEQFTGVGVLVHSG